MSLVSPSIYTEAILCILFEAIAYLYMGAKDISAGVGGMVHPIQ